MSKKAAAAKALPKKTARIPTGDDEGAPRKYEPKDLPHFTDIPELVESVEDENHHDWSLSDLYSELEKLSAEKAGIEAQADRLKKLASMLMSTAPQAATSYSVRVSDDGSGLCYIKPTKERQQLVRELLVVAGVTLKQLKKGTKMLPPNPPYVQLIRPEKPKDGNKTAKGKKR